MLTIHFDKPFKNWPFLHKCHASYCIHSFKVRVSQSLLFHQKGQPVVFSQLTHTTLGQASMEGLEQENQALREEMAIMQAKVNEMAAMQTQVDELTELVKTLKTAQNQPPPPPPVRTQAEAGDSTILGWEICFESPTSSTPPRSAPWFPPFTSGEILRPIACEPQCLLFNLQFTLLHQYQRSAKLNLWCLLFNMQSMFLLQL